MDVHQRLIAAGIRPTRQRVAIASMLFGDADRHVFAEKLHEEVRQAGFNMSLATVYNTLQRFKAAGLVREAAMAGAKSCFDTNMSDHAHFFVESSAQLIDIPAGAIRIHGLPDAPGGMCISHVDVVVHLAPK